MKKILVTAALISALSFSATAQQDTTYITVTTATLPFSTKMQLVGDMGKGMKKLREILPQAPEQMASFTQLLIDMERLGFDYIDSYPGNIVNGPFRPTQANEAIFLFRKRKK